MNKCKLCGKLEDLEYCRDCYMKNVINSINNIFEESPFMKLETTLNDINRRIGIIEETLRILKLKSMREKFYKGINGDKI